MREIQCETISEAVKELCIKACCIQTPDIKNAFKKAQEVETSAIGKNILGTLIKNGEIAQTNMMPICQDTGMTVVFAEIGQDVHIVGGLFSDAINEGVRRGYKDGYLRKSVVNEPVFERKNTTDNSPAVLHTEMVMGDKIKITVAPKGFGSENKSLLKMFVPADGLEGVKSLFLDLFYLQAPITLLLMRHILDADS